MPYIPPGATAVNFTLTNDYTAPTNSAVNFTLGETGNTIEGSLPKVTGAATAHATAAPGNISASIPKVTASLAASQSSTTLVGATPKVTAALTATVYPRYQAGWSKFLASPLGIGCISGTYEQTYTGATPAAANPVLSSIGYLTGKHYAEVLATYVPSTTYGGLNVGLSLRDNPLTGTSQAGANALSWGILSVGRLYHNGVDTAGGINFNSNSADVVIGFAVDSDAGKIWISVNGVWCGGGDPAAGTLPTFTDADIIGQLLHIQVGWQSIGRVATLRELSTQFTNPKPNGFLGWAEDGGAGAGWDDIRKINLKVDHTSDTVTRYDLPVRVTLTEESGNTFYDARWMYRDLDDLVRRFIVLDEDLNPCDTTLFNAAPSSLTRYAPPSLNTAYGTATTEGIYVIRSFWPPYDTNDYMQWETATGYTGQVKCNFDLAAAAAINRIDIENFHNQYQNFWEVGVKSGTIYGTNSATAFANVDYNNFDNLTRLTSFGLDPLEHKTIDFDNDTAFRYYVFRLHDNHGGQSIGINKVKFYRYVPSKFEFVTTLPEVSPTVDTEFYLHWNTAAYDNLSNIVVDYGYTVPVNAETEVIFPDLYGRREGDLVFTTPAVTGAATGRNFGVGGAPAYINGTAPPVTAAITATYIKPPVADISATITKVRATATARSGNRIKANLTNMTATGISATSEFYAEERLGAVSAALASVRATMVTGARLKSETPAANATGRATAHNTARISATAPSTSARMSTGIMVAAALAPPTAGIKAANGTPADIAGFVGSIQGNCTAHEIGIRVGFIPFATMRPVHAQAFSTTAKRIGILATLPSMIVTTAGTTHNHASVATTMPSPTGSIRAASGIVSAISATLPTVNVALMRAATVRSAQLLKHRRGEIR